MTSTLIEVGVPGMGPPLSSFDSISESSDNQAVIEREGRRVYLLTAAGGIKKKQRAEFDKIRELVESSI